MKEKIVIMGVSDLVYSVFCFDENYTFKQRQKNKLMLKDNYKLA